MQKRYAEDYLCLNYNAIADLVMRSQRQIIIKRSVYNTSLE
ncbi:hypothetical protein APA_4133 [Pseudanabaena sp. lw0831]|nr:hypothetical protein APA_4133 [Pseudanabaena sp. lw0831]